MKRLRIYADKAFLPQGTLHTLLLYPFWGNIPEAPGDKDAGRFDEYAATGGNLFTLVSSPAEADFLILPFEWKPQSPEHVECARRLAQVAENHSRRVIVFFNNDSDEPVPLDNAVVFRTSFSRSRRRKNEFAVPAWSADFLGEYLDGRLQIREKVPLPVVGYCGYVDYDLRHPRSILAFWLRRLLGRAPKPAAALRGRAVRALQKASGVEMRYVYRFGFAGGATPAVRREYVRNLVDSDYPLVARGAGNFSYRLYEVLSCGRIPLFIDTDCVLPFDHIVNWKDHMVWADVEKLDTLPETIVRFHSGVAADEFRDMQQANRRLYEEWIKPAAFFRNLWRCLE